MIYMEPPGTWTPNLLRTKTTNLGGLDNNTYIFKKSNSRDEKKKEHQRRERVRRNTIKAHEKVEKS